MTSSPTERRSSVPRTFCDGCFVAYYFWALLTVHGLAGPADSNYRALVAVVAVLLAATHAVTARSPSLIRRGVVLAVALLVLPRLSAELAAGGLAVGLAALVPSRLSGLGTVFVVAGFVTYACSAGPLAGIATPFAALLDETFRATPAPGSGSLAVTMWLAAWAGLVLAAGYKRDRARSILVAGLVIGVLLGAQSSIREGIHGALSAFADHGHAYRVFSDFDPTALLVAVVLGCASCTIDWSLKAERRASRWLPAVALAVGMVGALVHIGWRFDEPDRRVLFVNAGGLDWKRPRIGTEETGMFGLLPEYLRGEGWEVGVVDPVDLRETGVVDTRILVLINCHHVWLAREKAAVENFVRAGGALLVLGDHTDVFGLMRGHNSLLADWGIEFRYDSAMKPARPWSAVASWNSWPLGLAVSPEATGIAVGASLAVRWPAVSVMGARYAYSDAGIPTNVRGAFLGNYKLDVGERRGDLDLVAARALGAGVVLAYGDTSGFQNGGLAESWASHGGPVFDRLARGRSNWFGYYGWTLAAFALFLVLWGARRRSLRDIGIALSALVAGLAGSELTGRYLVGGVSAPQSPAGGLVVDRACHPDIGHWRAGWNWPSGLTEGAMRHGKIISYEVADPSTMRGSDTLAILAPRVAPSLQRIDELERFVARGGTLVVAASGAQSARAVAPMLDRFGAKIAGVTLGRVPRPHEESPASPRLCDASPVVTTGSEDWQVLIRYGDHELAVARRMPGGGAVVIIGDSRFFGAHNMNDRDTMWPGNIRFVDEVFATFCHGVLEPRLPLLPAPRRPSNDD